MRQLLTEMLNISFIESKKIKVHHDFHHFCLFNPPCQYVVNLQCESLNSFDKF